MLQVEKLCCGYGKKEVVHDVSFSLEPGQILCLLGPNGVGKTTFFKTLLGFLPPLAGRVLLDGEDMHSWSRKRFARTVAYVPQATGIPFPFSGHDVVVAGRNAHTGITSSPSKDDRQQAERSMKELGIWELRSKIYTEMSGGERQMILIARALAQNPQILVMDEPTSNLDYGNQIKIINLIHYLARRNMAVVMTTHSPDQVLLCHCRVIVFCEGRQASEGEARQIITENMLQVVYGVEADVRTVRARYERSVQVCVPTVNFSSMSEK